jgi:hypothetical protein
MAWGTGSSTVASRNQNNGVNVGERLDGNGDVAEMRTFGGKTESTEEVYVDASSFANLATNGQSGTSGIVSTHNLIESNTDFCKAQKTTIAIIAAAGFTTTTTTTTTT